MSSFMELENLALRDEQEELLNAADEELKATAPSFYPLPMRPKDVQDMCRSFQTEDAVVDYVNFLQTDRVVAHCQMIGIDQRYITQVMRETWSRFDQGISLPIRNDRAKTDSAYGWGSRSKSRTTFKYKAVEHVQREVTNLKENRFHLIGTRKHDVVNVKPTLRNWTPKRGRDYIYTLADRLRGSGTPKNIAVMGNGAAKWLLQCVDSNVSKKYLAHILSSVQVYSGNMNDTTLKTPSNVLLSDYFPKVKTIQPVYFKGVKMTLDNVESFHQLFKRDVPVWKSLVKHLNGEEVDLPKLRASLVSVAERTMPKPLVVGAEEITTTNFTLLKGKIRDHEFSLVARYFSGDKQVDGKRLTKTLTRYQKSFLQMFAMPSQADIEVKEEVLEEIGMRAQSPYPQPFPMPLDNLASRYPIKPIPEEQPLKKNPFRELFEVMKGFGLRKPIKIAILCLALSQQTSVLGFLSVLSMHIIDDYEYWWAKFTNFVYKLMQFESIPLPQSGEETKSQEVIPDKSFDSKEGFMSWFFAQACELSRLLFEGVMSVFISMFGEAFLPSAIFAQVKEACLSSDLAKFVRLELLKQTAKSFADWMIGAVKECLSVIKRCCEQRSLTPLLNPALDVSGWKSQATALRIYYSEVVKTPGQVWNEERFRKLREDNQIPSHWHEPMTHGECEILVRELIERGEQIRVLAAKDRVLDRDVALEIASLTSFLEGISTGHGLMANRIQPYGVCLVGPAGAGKTGLADEMFKVIGRSRGYSIEPTATYSWQLNVNFQDGFGPSHWCVKMDDIDQSVAQPSAGFDDHIQTVIKVINNAPLPVEQSRVELKGKVGARPLLVTYCSNFEKGKTLGRTLQPNAWFRRLPMWVTCHVKSEYAGENGMMDPSKVEHCKDGELYDLQVQFYDAAVRDFPYTSPVSVTRSQLFILLRQKFDKHIEDQREFLTRGAYIEACPNCFATLDAEGNGCSCEKIKQMKSEIFEKLCEVSSDIGKEVWSSVKYSPKVWGGLAMTYLFVFHRERFKKVVKEMTRIQRVIEHHIENVTHDAKFTMLTARQAITTTQGETHEMISKVTLSVDKFNERFDRAMSFIPSVEMVAVMVAMGASIWAISRSEFQMLAHNAAPGFVPSGWIRAPQEFKPGMPTDYSTFTLDDVVKQVRECLVTVKTVYGVVQGLVVSHNLVLTVEHIVLKPGEKSCVDCTITQNGIDHQIEGGEFSYTRIAHDAILIKVPGLAGKTGCYKKFWYSIDLSVSLFDECYIVKSSEVVPLKARVGSLAGGKRVFGDANTVNGDCGYPYVAKMNKGWRIVGIHHQLLVNLITKSCVATIVTQDMMRTGAERLASTLQCLVIPKLQTSLQPEKQTYKSFPEKSEVWTAVTHHGVQVAPVGTAEIQVHGSTMKSKVKETIFAEDFRDIEEKYCGRPRYYERPEFYGKMIDGKWKSPYSNSLTPLDRAAMPNLEILWLSIADNMSVLPELQNDGYSMISAEEAIVGIPGSIIQSIEMNTSVGPPYNQAKKNFVCITPEKEAHVSPALDMQRKEFEAVIEQGDIPAPIALCMLKDEQISWEKNLKLEARVFNCYPFAFNWLLKMYMAPLDAYRRANNRVFGSMVGINMTSQECESVVEVLQTVNPKLDRIIETDIKKQDKSENGVFIDAVALCNYGAAKSIGHAYPDRVYTLLQANRNTCFVIKNDFFFLGCTNGSGGFWTVQINDECNSLMHKYFYYRQKYPDGLPPDLRMMVLDYMRNFLKNHVPGSVLQRALTFRDHCAACTYGDDSLLAVAPGVVYDPDRIPQLGLECGFVYTDGAKTKDGKITWKHLDEVQFLKRKFVFRQDVERYVAQLSMKTIAKMLTLCKASSLTDKDHNAALLTDVAREMAYYAEEQFDEIVPRLLEAARKYELTDSAYFAVKTYGEYREQIKAGTFSTWSRIEEEKPILQSKCNRIMELI